MFPVLFLERFQEVDPASNPIKQEIKLVALTTVLILVRRINVLNTFPAHPLVHAPLATLWEIPVGLLNAQLVRCDVTIPTRIQ